MSRKKTDTIPPRPGRSNRVAAVLPTAFQQFFKKMVEGSGLLLTGAGAALVWANLWPESYHAVWHAKLTFSAGPFHIAKTAAHWIDEALMAFFFFIVGLEIKREILVGELASLKGALLPIAAAVGGMVCPALIYLYFNWGTAAAKGWGIPMATDIAFSLAVLAVLGKRVPFSLRIFLSAFAIADDLGAVLIIALFYTQTISLPALAVSGGFTFLLILANLLWFRRPVIYALLGIGLWAAVLQSGVHATVAGVVVAMTIPARGRYDTDTFIQRVKELLDRFACEPGSCGYTILLNKNHLQTVRAIELSCQAVETPLQRFENSLHAFVTLVVLPLFALANAGIAISDIAFPGDLLHPLTLGITLGLAVGKPIGILIFTLAASVLFRAPLPSEVTWRQILGVGILGGIGFTMSLFISGLSFSDPELMELSKLGVLLGSFLTSLLGLAVLGLPSPSRKPGS